jgi:Sulfotransferase family
VTTQNPHVILIGGYTKSGTTFLGRVLSVFEGVYSKGEMDYLRIIAGPMKQVFAEYSRNIQIVNREVYDGYGSLAPLTEDQQTLLQRQLFTYIFFNGKPVPSDCRVMVEKSPNNVFNIMKAKHVFKTFTYMNIYRPGEPVFKSLMRHMADHRDPAYLNPDSKVRRSMLHGFEKRWQEYIRIINLIGSQGIQLSYDNIVADLQGFVDYLEHSVFQGKLARTAGPEGLTKETYLASLPPEKMEKSLVQAGPSKIELSDYERNLIAEKCGSPSVTFDF